MKQLAARARRWTKMIRDGHSRFLFDRLRRAVWSQERFLILRKDLTEVQHARLSAVQFSIRPFEASDLSILEGEPFSAEDADAREQRRHWIEGGLPGCYVAVLKSGEPCYMQWMLRHSDRQAIRDFFGDTLPSLDPTTVLLEGAYTSPRYRRLPIMPAAMARIASLGREYGAREAIVSIAEGNTTMIKSAQWAGFKTASVTVKQRRLFRRLQIDSPLPASWKISLSNFRFDLTTMPLDLTTMPRPPLPFASDFFNQMRNSFTRQCFNGRASSVPSFPSGQRREGDT